MLYLVLFATLAIGFYAATTMSVQVTRNERDGANAMLAADSGLSFMRYQLAQVSTPASTTGTAVIDDLLTDLKVQLESTTNLGSNTVTKQGTDAIVIPSIDLGNGSTFSASIRWAEPNLILNVTGQTNGTNSLTRIASLKYARKDVASTSGPPATALNFGIAAKSKIQVKNSVSTKVLGTPSTAGSMLSTLGSGVSIATGNGTISGDLSVMSNTAQVSLGGGSVGGATFSSDILANHVHVVAPPTFPTVDTAPFKALAVNVYPYTSGGHYKNIRVPPNTDPRFNGGDVIDGILYIESPNNVTFRGHATVNGIIVFENKGNESVNVLDFKGNVTPTTIPNTAEFTAIKAAAVGLSILAPTASVSMSGSVDATLEGSMLASKVSLNGSADLTFKSGSIISLGTSLVDVSGKTVNFTGTGADKPPTTGVTFPSPPPPTNFKPDPTSYLEAAQ